MEKYIFDCRQNLHESPKYLKRNHKVSHLPSLEYNANLQYLKNKVFLTFDYSYYQHIPKTASMHIGNRINSLNSLVDNSFITQEKTKQVATSIIDTNQKWKKQKQNNPNSIQYSPKKTTNSKYRKKIKLPVNSMPGVGDYYCQSKTIQKKIVYDVKIRGKPISKKMIQGDEQMRDGEQNSHNNVLKQINSSSNISKFKKLQNKQYDQNIRVQRNSKSANGYRKERRVPMKIRKVQQQYAKFISSIQISNVWKKLMQKHRLKGSKFDIYTYNQ